MFFTEDVYWYVKWKNLFIVQTIVKFAQKKSSPRNFQVPNAGRMNLVMVQFVIIHRK